MPIETLKRRQKTGAATPSRTRKKATPRRGSSNLKPLSITTPEERRRMIAEAAYFKAQTRGFGDPERDWYEAEAEIDAQLTSTR